MRLSSKTKLFSFYGIPVLGSLATGDVIGLDAAGYAVCQRMAREEVARSEVDAADPQLAEALERGCFLEGAEAPSAACYTEAYVHVTQRCNLSCTGCYSLDADRNRLADAPRESFAVAFEKLVEIGVRSVIVSGGEPFLREDLAGVCADAKRAGIAQITVLSNGLPIDEEKLWNLQPYVDLVSISFDGVSAEAPSHVRGEQRFDRLVRAVELVRYAGIQPHIIPTVHPLNIDDIAAYLRLATSLGTTCNFSLLSCCSNAALAFDEDSLRKLGNAIYELGKQEPIDALDVPVGSNLSLHNSCGAGVRMLSVGADGTVYPCHMLHYPPLAMGNIFSDPVHDIIAAPVVAELAGAGPDTIEGCGDCECAPFCGGGCRARAYFESSFLQARDPFCTLIRTFYDRLGTELSSQV